MWKRWIFISISFTSKLIFIMDAFLRLSKTFAQNQMRMIKDILNSNNTRKQHIPKQKKKRHVNSKQDNDYILTNCNFLRSVDLHISALPCFTSYNPPAVKVYLNYAWIVTPSFWGNAFLFDIFCANSTKTLKGTSHISLLYVLLHRQLFYPHRWTYFGEKAKI